MAWDERVYGREYDLDLFNIVAVSDFNMGAMENKGLNIFNSRYVLADPGHRDRRRFRRDRRASSAHEYFHNWSGDRVTCRDWFQLSLKEGFTVFRDQSFSADMGSKSGQTDRGRAHAADGPVSGGFGAAGAPGPARQLHRDFELLHGDRLQQGRRADPHVPHGAWAGEVPRGHRPLFRTARWRSGDLRRFREGARGCAAASTCRAFKIWYSQAGTPQVGARLDYDPEAQTATLRLDQRIAPTPGQPDKTADADPAPDSADRRGQRVRACVRTTVLLDQSEQEVRFDGIGEAAVAVDQSRLFGAGRRSGLAPRRRARTAGAKR